MKKGSIGLVLAIFSIVNIFGQAPEKMNYQGVLRNSSEELIENSAISLRVYLLEGSEIGLEVYSETHSVNTDTYGRFAIQIGTGEVESGDFSTIDWAYGLIFLKTEIDETGGGEYIELSTVQLVTVPYALYANDVANKDDADADPANEIQNLDLTNNVLTITNNQDAKQINLAPYAGANTDNQELDLKDTYLSISGGNTVDLSSIQDGVDDADNNPTNELQNLTLDGNKVVLPYDSSKWITNSTDIYYNTGNVGIGSSNPASKLEVRSNVAGSNALFQVINSNNDTVFAVYPDGVKVFVDASAKGKVGGFAVSGRSPSKGGEIEYLRVTADSTRIYVNESISGKGKVGGFAVSGRSPSKGTINDYLQITRDSTRIYVNESAGKGKVGGFAVSGRSPSKATTQRFMDMTKDNYFIGHSSGQKITTGLYNTFLGYQTGANNTEGDNNVFIGLNAGNTNTTGWDNVFIGSNAGLKNTTGLEGVFIGNSAGASNTTGIENLFLGNYSGKENTTANYNTFIGNNTGANNTTGYNNLFAGTYAGFTNITGDHNVFLGYDAGSENIDGNYNVFIGSDAGVDNINGDYNICIGEGAGYENNGNRNISIGKWSGMYNYNGNDNVFIGNEAGLLNDSGNNNLFLGYQSGYNNVSGSQSVLIGYQAGYNETSSNKLYIENSDAISDSAMIYGEFDNDYLALNATVTIRDIFSIETGDLTSLTDGGSISVNKSSYVIGSGQASAVLLNATTSINDGSKMGQLLVLYGNNDANTITIYDNANTKLGANRVLGLNDVLTLMWNGTDWLEISYTDN